MKTFENNHEVGQKAVDLLPEKQRILYAIDCAFLVLLICQKEFPDDKSPQEAIDLAIKSVFEGDVKKEALERAAFRSANSTTYSAFHASYTVYHAALAASDVAHSACDADYAAYHAAQVIGWGKITDLYNQANQPWNEQYRTPDTVGIAREIIRTRNFDLMSILADAIIDLGGDDTYIRNAKGLSNWALYYLTQTRSATVKN